MPAIKKLNHRETEPVTLSHYQFKNSAIENLRIVTSDNSKVMAELKGFICTQGAKFLEGAILVKAHALAVTNGDGSEDDQWRQLPQGQFIYCMLIEQAMPICQSCFVLVNDDGWPMVTTNQRDYFAGETEYKSRNSLTFCGSALG